MLSIGCPLWPQAFAFHGKIRGTPDSHCEGQKKRLGRVGNEDTETLLNEDINWVCNLWWPQAHSRFPEESQIVLTSWFWEWKTWVLGTHIKHSRYVKNGPGVATKPKSRCRTTTPTCRRAAEWLLGRTPNWERFFGPFPWTFTKESLRHFMIFQANSCLLSCPDRRQLTTLSLSPLPLFVPCVVITYVVFRLVMNSLFQTRQRFLAATTTVSPLEVLESSLQTSKNIPFSRDFLRKMYFYIFLVLRGPISGQFHAKTVELLYSISGRETQTRPFWGEATSIKSHQTAKSGGNEGIHLKFQFRQL